MDEDYVSDEKVASLLAKTLRKDESFIEKSILGMADRMLSDAHGFTIEPRYIEELVTKRNELAERIVSKSDRHSLPQLLSEVQELSLRVFRALAEIPGSNCAEYRD